MSLAVSKRKFDRLFAERFGRVSTHDEFALWCVSWGGALDGERCVLEELV
jgi:hypothetical protein